MTRLVSTKASLLPEKCLLCDQPCDVGRLPYCKSCKRKDYYCRIKAAGRCVNCKKQRDGNGTTIHCRKCANKFNLKTKLRLSKYVKIGRCVRCGKPRRKTGTKTLCRYCADTESKKRVLTRLENQTS
jgi:hypothetical protein